MTDSLASIIIVNWNGRHLLQDCLDAILKQTYQSYEIIVVDNASEDDSVDFISKQYPQVKIVQLDENTGFTGGNIAGFRSCSGEFIVLLNNDAVLSELWLEQMVLSLKDDSSLGSCSSKIIISGTDKIDSVGDTFTKAFSGTKMGEYQPENLFNERLYIQGACAAAAIYKRAMLDSIGFLDEDFYFNHEDTDLNMRAWLAGWRCLYVPEAVVYHKVNATVGEFSDTGVYYFSRNSMWVWLKNVPLKFMFLYLPHRIFYEFAFFGYFCLMKRKWQPFFRGKLDGVKGVPKMLKKRKFVQNLIALDDEEIRDSLVPLIPYFRKRLKDSGF